MVLHEFEQQQGDVKSGMRDQRRGIPPVAYDWLSGWAGVDVVQWQLIAQAGVGERSTVLEIGVGTGNLSLKVKRAIPTAHVIGLDVDAASLAAAAKKARRAGADLQLDHGSAIRLPYEDASVDRVLCAFVLHHIPTPDRLIALQEMHRVLRPAGSLHLLDFVTREKRPPTSSWLDKFNPGRHHHKDLNRSGPDPVALMRDAGLTDPTLVGAGRSALGPHAFFRAHR